MVVFGGCGVNFEALNDVWIYRLADNSWREVLPHGYGPSPRWLASAVALAPPRVQQAPPRAPPLAEPPGSLYDVMAQSPHPERIGARDRGALQA